MSKLLYCIINDCLECPFLMLPESNTNPNPDSFSCNHMDASNLQTREIMTKTDYLEVQHTCLGIPFWCPLVENDYQTGRRTISVFGQIYALRQRLIYTLTWMITQLKWHYRQTKNVPPELTDNEVEWSPEMREALNLLEELYL